MDSRTNRQSGRRLMTALGFCVLIVASVGGNASADDTGKSLAEALRGVSFGVLAYVDYSNGQHPLENKAEADFNRFTLTRGYFTVRKQMNNWLGMRATIDIHQDDLGDYKVRQKYFYAEVKPADLPPLTAMKSEIGLGHIPWLDFEEHINPYRSQGTMAVERAGVFNSADVGVSLRGDFGDRLQDAGAKTGNDHYDGRFGSWHIGIYNGGGYHAKEQNENKVIEARLTARPFPDRVPGLQVSYLGIFGDGNTDKAPDYIVNLGMISYEHPDVILTAQLFGTKGNAKGTWVDTTSGKTLQTVGYSAFGNVRIPGSERKLSVFGRYDHFDADIDDIIAAETACDMYIAGVAYEFYKGNHVLLVVESTNYESDAAGKGTVPAAGRQLGHERKVQAVYQIKF